MVDINKVMISNLQARLVAIRLEKTALVKEIASSAITPMRKEQAVQRYSFLVKQLRSMMADLEAILNRSK